MARDYDASEQESRRESHVTRDRDMVRDWAGEHEATPVRYSGTEEESGRLRIVPETDRTEDHEEMTWDDFFGEMRDDDVVVYHGKGRSEPFEVLDRNEAVGRSSLEDEEVERALLEGETVTTEITETTVVERTSVEEATIESEVIDRQRIEEDIVDAELVTRDVEGCEITNVSARDDGRTLDFDQFEAGFRSSGDLEVDVRADVNEEWTLTKEIVEQLTIESKIVDTDATETDTIESDTIQSSIELEGVQQSILESDLLDSEDVTSTEIIESGAIESDFAEDDAVHTTLYERKTVEDELTVRKRLEGEITDAETTSSSTMHSETVESEIITDRDFEGVTVDRDAGMGTETSTVGDDDLDTETTTTTTTTAETDATDEPTMASDETMGESPTDDTMDDTTMTESATLDDDEVETGTVVTPTDADEGKDVVDATGERIGVVVEVDEDTIYVDPHPSLADRIKRALDWGDASDDASPIPVSHIARITDDEVELNEVEEFDTYDDR